MKYTAMLAFDDTLNEVLLVQKISKIPWLNGKWNGVGGKLEIGESPIGGAIREFGEESGILVHKDDVVNVEHQRFMQVTKEKPYEIYWYAVHVSMLHRQVQPHNDVGEPLRLFPANTFFMGESFCPNVEYLIPKARVMLRTPYLDRPAG